MNSPYQMFQTDAEREQKGVVLDYGGFRVRVRRAGGSNADFAKVLQRRTKPYRTAIQHERLPEDVAAQVMAETYAEAVIVGWESKVGDEWQPGIVGPDGTLQPYNHATVTKTLMDLPDLFADIRQQSEKAALFQAAQVEADAKN